MNNSQMVKLSSIFHFALRIFLQKWMHFCFDHHRKFEKWIYHLLLLYHLFYCLHRLIYFLLPSSVLVFNYCHWQCCEFVRIWIFWAESDHRFVQQIVGKFKASQDQCFLKIWFLFDAIQNVFLRFCIRFILSFVCPV